jgi:hypothetical protein
MARQVLGLALSPPRTPSERRSPGPEGMTLGETTAQAWE